MMMIIPSVDMGGVMTHTWLEKFYDRLADVGEPTKSITG